MIAAKHFDPVVGIDIHIIQPPGPVPPLPIPHPFVGFVIDAVEYAPVIGGTVKVNGVMRGVAGTGGKNAPHIPIGGTFIKPPGNDCEIFMGSQTVAFDGDPASRLGLMALSCQDVGLPPPPRTKPHAKGQSQYLPLSVVLAVPGGPPVLIGGPPTITAMGALKVLGPFIRFVQRSSKFSKHFAGASGWARGAAKKVLGERLGGLAARGICFLTGHPVDVANGQVLTDAVDLELPGPLPLKFERVWYSRSDRRGPLGHGWHHSFDLGLRVTSDGVIVRLADGRPAGFSAPLPGEPAFNRTEKLFLHLTERGYELEDLDGLIHHFGWATADGPEVPLDHVRDPNNNRIQLVRDRGRLAAFVDSGGRRLPVETDAAGRITAVRVPDPDRPGETFAAVTYGYGPDGDLTEVRDALGHPFRYAYLNHQLVRETDRAGLSFYFTYDGDGWDARCIRTWGDGDVFLRDLFYDPARQRTTFTDSLGHTTACEYNDAGLVVRVTDPLGGVTETAWSLFNDKLTETDPAGNVTAFAYDDAGRRVSVTDAAGATAASTFDAAGNETALTDPGGHVWTREYDGRRNVVAVTDPLGNRRAFAVDARGLPVTVADPLGRSSHLGWTPAGLLASFTDRTGARTAFEYDTLGRAVRRTDALGHAVRTGYDRRGGIVSFTDELGRTTRRTLDPAGNLSATVDPLGRARAFEYGVMGRVAEARTPLGRTTRYRYDTEGRLAEARNPAGDVWRFARDAAGNVLEETTFDGRTLRYRYDAAGALVESRNARGQAVTFDRDKAGRTLTRTLPDGSTAAFKYTPAGRMLAATNAAAEVKWAYDPCGRVVRETLNGAAVESAYDPAGDRVKRVSPLGRVLTFGHDAEGRLESVADGGAPVFRSRLDALGREVERTAGAAAWRWDYASTGETLGVTVRGRNNLDRRYITDGAGLPTGQTDSTFGRTDTAHDADGYLTGVRHADGTAQDYAYDPAGNVRRPGNVGVRRDADGQVVEKMTPAGAWRYSYDALGQLARADADGGPAVTFDYDPLGRRVRKTAGGDTTAFTWDGDILLGETAGESTEYLFRPGTFEPMAVFADDGPALLDCDPVGLPRTAVRPDGELAWQADFEPFGEVRTERGRAGLVNVRYPGQYADAETGLVYNRFRYLDPDQRAYTTPDPLGLLGNAGVWEYVPSPLVWADPFGLARGLWDLTRAMTDAARTVGNHNYSRHVTTGLWWSRDTAGHGGSAFKVFTEGSDGTLTWFRDADKYGDFIDPLKKHKGPTGKKMCR